ncbi:Hypothetical protein, putative, partial [Bodo saltans]
AQMGQSFVFALNHVENEFVRVQQIPHQPNSLEGSTTSAPGHHSSYAPGARSAVVDDDDPYEAQARLSTNIEYSTLQHIVLPESIRQHIVLPESIRVNTSHIAVLYCIDGNRDGVFSYDDLTNFVKWVYQEVPADVSAEDFAETVQAKATLRLWKECRQYAEARRATTRESHHDESDEGDGQAYRDEAPPEAADYFVDWMVRFLNRNFPLMVPKISEAASTPTTSRTPPPAVSLPGLIGSIDEAAQDDAPHLPDAPPPPPSFLASASPKVLVPDVYGWEALECLYVLLAGRCSTLA